jgi:hypothetical protein
MNNFKVILKMLVLWFLAVLTLPLWTLLLPWVLTEWEKLEEERNNVST